ncbi:MAG: hypothetical protein FWG84_00285 [Bacteroidales bacterium]|nr:hypothetical protein [Bacteroidales bacterium]
MTSYVLTVNEENMVVKSLLNALKYFCKTDAKMSIVRQKTPKMTGMQEAIEDIKKGRVTTCKDYEEYEKSINS